MTEEEKKQGVLPFGSTVAGYGFIGLGGPMKEYLPRERDRMRRWAEQEAAAGKISPGDLDRLKREQAERRRRMEKGEVEGPPNPYRPHRRR